jgi:hypothetical protein
MFCVELVLAQPDFREIAVSVLPSRKSSSTGEGAVWAQYDHQYTPKGRAADAGAAAK